MVDLSMALLNYQRVNLHFPMVFLGFSHFPMGFPMGFPMVLLNFPWFSHGFPMVFPWFLGHPTSNSMTTSGGARSVATVKFTWRGTTDSDVA